MCMLLYPTYLNRRVFIILNSIKMSMDEVSFASTRASKCNSGRQNSGSIRTDEDGRIGRYNRSKNIAIDKFTILDNISRQIFQIYKFQQIASSIYQKSKHANYAQSMYSSIEKAYTRICKRQWTFQEEKQAEQFLKIQKMKYNILVPGRCVYELGQQWIIWDRLIDTIKQYRIQREMDQTRLQNAMLVLFNLRSFLFGTLEQQQLITTLIQELFAITRLLNPQRLVLFWEFLCKQVKIFMQSITRYEIRHNLAFIQ